MKKNFIVFSILSLIILIMAILIGGFPLYVFFDLVSLFFVINISFLLIFTQYKFIEFFRILRNLFRKEFDNKKDLYDMIHLFKSLKKYLIISGLSGLIIGLIGIFSFCEFENINSFFKGLSASLLSPAYSLIIIGFIIEPIILRFEGKRTEFE